MKGITPRGNAVRHFPGSAHQIIMPPHITTQSERSVGRLFASLTAILFTTLALLYAI